jgi:FlaG/FlaF family flagellin (archaellin)
MKILNSKRGVTPVVTMLLIIVIVVAAIIVISFFVTNYVGNTLSNTEKETKQGQIFISNIALKQGTNDTLILTVNNIGDAKITVDKAYINEVDATVSGAGDIAVDSTRIIEAKYNVAFKPDKTYVIKVVCTNGYYYIETWTR